MVDVNIAIYCIMSEMIYVKSVLINTKCVTYEYSNLLIRVKDLIIII